MKAAIIGCGHVSYQHISQLKKMPGIEIVGVCDKEKTAAENCAKMLGLKKYYTDPDELLKECNPHVAHILTPPQSHKDLAIKFIETGCHAFVEKPMATNSEEVEQMIKAAENAKVQLGVCHNFLFIPALIEAKKMTEENKFGEIVFAEVFWRISRNESSKRYEKAEWIYDLPGGIAHEIAAHPIYLLNAFVGNLNVRGVTTKERKINLPGITKDIQILLEADTALANISISTNSQPTEKYLRILGTKCSVHIDLGTNTLIKLKPIGKGNINKALANFNHGSQYIFQTCKNIILTASGRLPHGHDTLIKLFYSSLKGEIPNPVSGNDGLNVIKTLDQIWSFHTEGV